MKYVAIFAAAFAATYGTTASAQSLHYVEDNAAWVQAHVGAMPSDGIAANGRCGGISYGTGDRSCGTETGGPAGGLPSRN